MKRFALLSVFSLLLASAVFAPVAMAQELGEVDVQSVRLGPGGSVTVTGTIECVAGYFAIPNVEVRQKTHGNVNNVAQVGTGYIMCEADGPTAFTASGFGRVGELETRFRRGPATIRPSGLIISPDYSTYINWEGVLEAVHIR
jgi:hypothetical protein